MTPDQAMTSEAVAIITAITALLIGVGGFVIKMWKDHTKISERALDVIEKNATASEKLAGSIGMLNLNVEKNTQVTAASGEVTRQTKDTISQLMLELVKQRR